MSKRPSLPFIDWMKAVGIVLIVMGHVAGRPTNDLVPPIYPKQLGVAFFIFVIGYGLATEHRPRWQVLFNRLFEVYLFGGMIAVLLSVVMYATKGTLQLSNYEPFVLGVNVLLNNFPANPTTWYIGTYLHILVLWALVLRGMSVRPWMLVVSLAIEVPLRAALVTFAGQYIGYMLLTNWVTLFLLGMMFGQRGAGRQPRGDTSWHRFAFCGTLLAAVAVSWYLVASPRVLAHTFPFMRLSAVGPLGEAVTTSASVSLVYLTATWMVFQSFRFVVAGAFIRFLARNTLIVFIAHMPVFRALDSGLAGQIPAYAPRAVIQMLVSLLGLALLSELVTGALRTKALRDRLGRTWFSVSDVPVSGESRARPACAPLQRQQRTFED